MKLIVDVLGLAKRLVLIDEKFKELESAIEELTDELKQLARHVHQIDLRVARLEESRNSDRTQLNALITQLKLEAERFELLELRLKQLPSPTD